MTRGRDRIQKNANKYIVKNCPSAKYRMGMPWKILCEKESNCVKSIYCADCTDCVIKQVIDLCNTDIRPNEANIYKAGRMSLAVNIVGLFDIEEINK